MTAVEEDGGESGERKEHNTRSTASGTNPPTTPPPTKPHGTATNNLEEESPPKRLGFEDAGDSEDEDLVVDITEETATRNQRRPKAEVIHP